MRSQAACTVVVFLIAMVGACSDPSYAVVTGPDDAYDLLIVDGRLIARTENGFASVRVSGRSAAAGPLNVLELGGGARLDLAQRSFVSEGGASASLQWGALKTVVATRSDKTCVVAFEPEAAVTPGYSLTFLSCENARPIRDVDLDMRPVALAPVAGGVLLASRSDHSSRLALLESASGATRWTFESTPGAGDPVIAGDEALVLVDGDTVQAIRISDGSQRSIAIAQDDGYRIDAIGPSDRPNEIAVASCLCTPNGVVESHVSIVSSLSGAPRLRRPLPKNFAAFDVVALGRTLVAVGYTSKPSARPGDLHLGPR